MKLVDILFYLVWGIIVLLPFNAFLTTISSFIEIVPTISPAHKNLYPLLTMYFLLCGTLFGTFIGYIVHHKYTKYILLTHITCFALVIVVCSDLNGELFTSSPLQRMTLMFVIMTASACTSGILQSIMYGRFNYESRHITDSAAPIQWYMAGINLCGILIPLIVISLQLLSKNEQIGNYRKHQDELMAVFGFSFVWSLLVLPNSMSHRNRSMYAIEHSDDDDDYDDNDDDDDDANDNSYRDIDFSSGFRSYAAHETNFDIEMGLSDNRAATKQQPPPTTTPKSIYSSTTHVKSPSSSPQQASRTNPAVVPPRMFRILLDNLKLLLSIMMTAVAVSITYGQITPIGKFNQAMNEYLNSTTVDAITHNYTSHHNTHMLLVRDGPILLLSLNFAIIFGTLVPVGYVIHRLLESHLIVLTALRLAIVMLCAFYMPFVWWQVLIVLLIIGITNGHLFTLIYTLPIYKKKPNGTLLAKMLCICILIGFLLGHVITTGATV